MLKRNLAIAALVVMIGGGTANCTTVAQWTAQTAQGLSSETPTQVKVWGDVVPALDTFTRLADTAVNSGKLSAANLGVLSDIRKKIRDAYNTLKAANAAGQSLDFAALNAGLSLWVSFATTNGVAH